ncbi:MAG: VOC family protein [Cyclobacteriaceae bacterium]|nr:MAG: VOC family protein [Cyclobacteriaceae bacterium]
MEQRLTLITLGVADVNRATEFYEQKFGWKKAASSNDDITFFMLNGMMLSLFNRDSLAEDAAVSPAGTGFKGFTLAWNARSEAEVDAIVSDLKSNGVTVVKEPQHVFWGGYSGYVADVDGNLWEIAFNPFLPMDEHGNVVPE